MTSTKQHTISVVIPVYNREHLIERAVASVRSQTRQPDEIVVADDGSTDRTAEIVKAMDGVTYVTHANQGASEARNLGVRNASGRWIAFLDSDDYWFEDHLERMHAAISATDGGARMYFSDLYRTEAEGSESHWKRSKFSVDDAYELSDDGAAWVFKPRHPTMLQASVIERAAYLRLNGLWQPLKIRHDSHLFMLLGLDGPLCAVAGVSTQMTSDDDDANRLFGGGNRPGTKVYEQESLLLYRDLLDRTEGAPDKYRNQMRRRLKAAHFSMARILRAEGKRVGAAKHALLGATSSPKHTAISVLSRFGLASRDNA